MHLDVVAVGASCQTVMSLSAKSLIILRFPAWRETVEIQYNVAPHFREMCDDYQEVVDALAYWTQRSASEDKDATSGMPRDDRLTMHIACNYLETLNEVEHEILQYLQHIVKTIE